MYYRISNIALAIVGTVMLATVMGYSKPVAATEAFIGQIQYFPYNFAPRSWTFCNGQLLPISQNTALFSLLGTTFGGDGRTTFGLPDMRGRAPIHPGTGPGLSTYRGGERGGAETVNLSASQLPSHNHSLRGTNSLGEKSGPAGNTLSRDGRDQTYTDTAPDTTMNASSLENTGGGQAHNNVPPYLGLNCNIALNGVFPSRN